MKYLPNQQHPFDKYLAPFARAVVGKKDYIEMSLEEMLILEKRLIHLGYVGELNLCRDKKLLGIEIRIT